MQLELDPGLLAKFSMQASFALPLATARYACLGSCIVASPSVGEPNEQVLEKAEAEEYSMYRAMQPFFSGSSNKTGLLFSPMVHLRIVQYVLATPQ